MANEQKDVGIKISAPYHDVDNAGDVDLIFNSSWPSLAVAFEQRFTLLAGDYPKTIPHGLGFPPLAGGWWWYNGRMEQAWHIDVDKDNIYVFNDMIDYPGADVFFILVAYNIDISQNKDYPFIAQPQGARDAYNPNYGIKLSKEGKSIDSTDLRDYIIHSRCRSPMLLKNQAVNDTVNTVVLKYINPAGYVPWVWAFGSAFVYGTSVPSYTLARVGSQAYPRLGIDPNTGELSVQNAPTQGGLAALVVLRDPLFAATNVDVVY